MWTRKKEDLFINNLKPKERDLIEILTFVELQLVEFAATIDYDIERLGAFAEEELVDFIEWYLDNNHTEVVSIRECILILNLLYKSHLNADVEYEK